MTGTRGGRVGLVRCFSLIAATRISLRLLGFRRTARAAGWLGRRGRRRPVPLGSPLEAARAVATAAAFFPGRAVCLEQAVVLFIVLRRRGHPAALRIGVQPYPFQAHAWIELDGRPLFEGEGAHKFVAFPEVFA
jgi:hypothetical protein